MRDYETYFSLYFGAAAAAGGGGGGGGIYGGAGKKGKGKGQVSTSKSTSKSTGKGKGIYGGKGKGKSKSVSWSVPGGTSRTGQPIGPTTVTSTFNQTSTPATKSAPVTSWGKKVGPMLAKAYSHPILGKHWSGMMLGTLGKSLTQTGGYNPGTGPGPSANAPESVPVGEPTGKKRKKTVNDPAYLLV
tara:strand:- start:3901 stop:4461 length:561 start_codon:yes stop_codon:yes gene_type:complete